MRSLLLIALGLALLPRQALALGQEKYVALTPSAGSFALAQGASAAAIYVDPADWPGVVRATKDLQADVNRVTGVTPALPSDASALPATTIIIGTVGKSPIIDRLVREGKIDVSGIRGKWESFFLQTVANPLPGVSSALVIAGSDKRGTIYGIYDLSEEIGVSPWYWWADVTPRHADSLFVKAGKFAQGEPSVKYRGIFLNDEAPDLSEWVRANYGNVTGLPGVPATTANYGRAFYTKLFEVLLRLRGNYLWPAMWNNAFNEDDPANARLADEYGIVMGTSHQEPMLRAQKEWDRIPTQQRGGNWNWSNVTQRPTLTQFWRDGITRNKNFESIITMGLRAENDSGAETGLAATEEIVGIQRQILAEVMGRPASEVPQLWCLYKEVMSYYAQGLHPPDDITLLWAEDNWGGVRRLPTADERKRSGGAGIYYHFDYHGGPRSYQWINTSPLPKIAEQMGLAKQYGADRVWIVNVGHFKGQEIPTEYFLRLGWDTNRWNTTNTMEYTRLWAEREFGPQFAADIADLVAQYAKYNARRKPELLEPTTYSVANYNEADRVVADFNALADRAKAISAQLPAGLRDAFHELVGFPTLASAQVNELYVAAGKNILHAQQGRASANDWTERAHAVFADHVKLLESFNTELAGGKWNHFMDQYHIGYTSWQDLQPTSAQKPSANSLAVIDRAMRPVTPAAGPGMGVAVEGSAEAWPGPETPATLPKFDAISRRSHYIEVFRRGTEPFEATVATSAPWITVSATKLTVNQDQRLQVSVDWSRAPQGAATGAVTLTRVGGGSVSVRVDAFTPADVTRETLAGFAESEGVVAIEAEHFTRKTAAGLASWERVEDYGSTLSGMRSAAPVDVAGLKPKENSPSLEYRMYLQSAGSAQTRLVLGPALNFAPDRPVRIAVSFDDEAPQVVTVVPQNYNVANGNRDWEESVKNNARFVTTSHPLATAGYHTLKVWMVDPAVVLERVIVDTGGLKPSYLGPPESYRNAPKAVAQN
ncbi:MAG: glycosyl hydrolase 115 family protein [Verrucomicrobiota bacterium]